MNNLPDRLPSRPLRNWFLAWHIHTGDPADVIAKGFDLDPVLVADFLRGEVALMLGTGDCLHVCRRIRVAPSRLWPTMPDPGHTGRLQFDEIVPDLPATLLSTLPR